MGGKFFAGGEADEDLEDDDTNGLMGSFLVVPPPVVSSQDFFYELRQTKCLQAYNMTISSYSLLSSITNKGTQEKVAEAYVIAAIKFRGLNAATNFDMSRYDVKSVIC
ncbi:hypothetical protein SUGI_0590590 [Cryptomeria japonica]|nr:hypothetical protein SUGI_0590590 [Cryptomeria japonica]